MATAVYIDERERSGPPALEIALRRAKFTIPHIPPRSLPRERLVAKLDTMTTRNGPNGCVTVISAPVATGKTMLAAELARTRAAGSVAWCTLDPSDNSRLAFGVSVLEAVLASQSDRQTLVAGNARTATDALDEALLIAAYSEPLLLVLDECEHVLVANMHDTILRLIRQAPPTLSVLLLTDSDFPPSVASASDAWFLRETDLALTTDEVRSLFEAERLPIADDALEPLVQWTQGVPSTVALAAVAYRDLRDRERIVGAALKSQSAAHDVLFDRLVRRLPGTHRTMLAASAIADPVCGDLLAAITGRDDAVATLHDLVRAGAFFEPVAGLAGWFRHRHPSRELLSAAVNSIDRYDLLAMERRAARWFDEHGHHDRALDAAVAGEEWELVVDLVRSMWVRATFEDVDPRLRAVPEPPAEVQAARVEARAVACALQLERDDLALAQSSLEALRDELAMAPDDDELRLFAALVALRVARECCDAAAITTACNELTWASASPSLAAADRTNAALLATRAAAEVRLLAGDLAGAAELLERAGDDATSQGCDAQAADAAAALAVVTALSGKARRATALVEELGDGWVDGGDFSRGVRETARAICAYHEDRLPLAQAAASDARRALRPGVFRDVILTLVRARIAASIGDDDGAARCTARLTGNGEEKLARLTSDALGLVYRPRTDRNDRSDRVDESAVDAVSMHPYAFARANTREALALHAAQRDEEAWEHLERALVLVQRNAYWRLFADLGVDTRPLLCDYLSVARPSSQVAWQLVQRLPVARASDAAPIVEALTPRELAVLRHLPSMKSNREIAAEMFFSVNTVKTHLKSIYRKLGVNRRRAAVEEARARSLL